MTWRRLIAAETMRQWRPRLEEANREARQFGVGVRGGVEQVALHARSKDKKVADPHRLLERIQHSEADCYASGGSHLRAGAYTVRGKCYGEMSATVFFQMESRERPKIDC